MKYILFVIAFLLFPCLGLAQQWQTFRADNARSGSTDVVFKPDCLELSWQWKSPSPPTPAWDGPARWDAFSQIRDLPAMRQYDACFHPVSDGETLYFGSSSQDLLRAVDLSSGELKWNYVAGGPIRLAPTIDDNRILFGSDDGYVYCLNRNSGELIWKFNPSIHIGDEQRRLINNDRLISYFPIRTGIVVRDEVAYFGASLLPWRDSFICAVDVATGKIKDPKNHYVVAHAKSTLEGNLLVAEGRLIVPQGRVAPRLFERTSGKDLGVLPGGGGVTIVLTDTGKIVRTEGGRASRPGQVGVFEGKERVASFPRGRSIVVSGDNFYVIDGQKLFAAARMTNELKWSCEVDEPLELVMAGETLFVGGRDHVTAVRASDGQVLWSSETDGRVFGMALAGGRLIASTDAGAIHVFSQTADPEVRQQSVVGLVADSPSVSPVRDKNLVHRWVFHRSAMSNQAGKPIKTESFSQVVVRDQASSAPLNLDGTGRVASIEGTDRFEAIELDGARFLIDEENAANLPTEAIAIEAWVRVDQSQQWGGIAGCIQDDGATEHGWLLGYNDDHFCLAIAGGGNGLTYLKAPRAFTLKSWNHVVGTYNGREMRLYVNGSLAASSELEKGPISYAQKRYFSVGVYRDANESFPLKGALHEVRVYSTAIDAPTISRLFQSAQADFPDEVIPDIQVPQFISHGPYVRYVAPREVEVTYGTDQKCPTVVDLITEDGVKRMSSGELTRTHTTRFKDLPYRRILQYQIRTGGSEDAEVSESFSLDTHFDWTADDRQKPSAWAADLIAESPNPRGLVFVVGSKNIEKAKILSSESQFNVVLVVDSEADAVASRRQLVEDPEVVYGQGLSVSDIPIQFLPAASASVVIGDAKSEQMRRLVRPQGGVFHDGERVVWKRSALKGSGVWSHMYGQADNSAFGGEELSNASDRADLVTQWIGRPGPRYQTDRQNRKPAPLAAGGRLFLQGQQRMIALDSYSGVVLWSVESPSVMRWNVPHDCSNWCADENGVFVASEHQAWFVEGKTGKVARRFNIPSHANQETSQLTGRSWGFISRYNDQLIGTEVSSSAIYKKWWGSSQWFDSTGGADTHVVAGDSIFSMNPESGELQWLYPGLVLHPTITIMDDRIFFVEDKTPDHIASDKRRISLDQSQSYELVCLNAGDGQLQWRQPIDPFAGHLASFYLAGGGDEENRCLVTVASESTKKQFSVVAFDRDNGQKKWSKAVIWESNHHGKHISRPAIQGELMYLRPEVLSLADGSTIQRGFPGGHGCASYTLTTNGMFSRLGETTWWDVRTQKVNRFDRIRTDCWISVVPAQGMLLSAEGGGGCSCGSWLETSLGFLPRSVDESLPEEE
jgi:outer membrane protein assembly factor BamB